MRAFLVMAKKTREELMRHRLIKDNHIAIAGGIKPALDAVKGQDSIEIDFDGKKKFLALLPKPNAVFADFGADCGLGRLKDKD